MYGTISYVVAVGKWEIRRVYQDHGATVFSIAPFACETEPPRSEKDERTVW